MVVRPREECYQVVLVDEGDELVLETDEQAQFIMEQAHAAAMESHAPAAHRRAEKQRWRTCVEAPPGGRRAMKGEERWNISER
jgi:hypothetical protein